MKWLALIGIVFLQATSALAQRNCDIGRSYLLQQASHGNAKAQVKLGMIFERGDGPRAIAWFVSGETQDIAACIARRNADIDSTESCGPDLPTYTCYGSEQDFSEAVYWYRKAAAQGNPDGENNLGRMYQYGLWIKRDFGQAIFWYRKAIARGNVQARVNLGRMYERGTGVERDYNQAISLYQQAAKKGSAEAENNLGRLYENGIGVERDFAQAISWYREALRHGSSRACVNLAGMYEDGAGVGQDYREAASLYRKAARNGDVVAEISLGWLYQNGYGVTRDVRQAVFWYRRAAYQYLSGAMEMPNLPVSPVSRPDHAN
jgi:TPR repeat protein